MTMMFSVVLLGGIILIVLAILLTDWLGRRKDQQARNRAV